MVIDIYEINNSTQGININGMDSDFFEITILGVSYSLFEDEFPHHVKAYND